MQALLKGNESKKDDLYCFEVLTAVTMKMPVFWVVAPCTLV
jgi:hypothetical protein